MTDTDSRSSKIEDALKKSRKEPRAFDRRRKRHEALLDVYTWDPGMTLPHRTPENYNALEQLLGFPVIREAVNRWADSHSFNWEKAAKSLDYELFPVFQLLQTAEGEVHSVLEAVKDLESNLHLSFHVSRAQHECRSLGPYKSRQEDYEDLKLAELNVARILADTETVFPEAPPDLSHRVLARGLKEYLKRRAMLDMNVVAQVERNFLGTQRPTTYQAPREEAAFFQVYHWPKDSLPHQRVLAIVDCYAGALQSLGEDFTEGMLRRRVEVAVGQYAPRAGIDVFTAAHAIAWQMHKPYAGWRDIRNGSRNLQGIDRPEAGFSRKVI